MKIVIVKKAEVKKDLAEIASCPFIVEDMRPPRR